MESQKLTEQIINEMNSIMETQEHLGAEKENYRHNENAVKIYAEILKMFEDNDLKEKELKMNFDFKDRELKLKALEEERLMKELELKIQELKIESDSKLRNDIFGLVKSVGGGVTFLAMLLVILKYEDKGVITSKTFGPFVSQAFRFLLPK